MKFVNGLEHLQRIFRAIVLSFSGIVWTLANMFRDMVLNYIQNGVTEYFDIQINNTDPSTSVGSQIGAYYGCHLTGDIPLSILNDEESMLNYDFNFAYTRVGMIQKFTDPTNVGQ